MTKSDIINAINARLLEQWPNRTVYVDVCPIDFARPSTWIAVDHDDVTPANARLIRRDMQITLTLFDERDDHYDASWSRLAADADTVLHRLGTTLRVGSRTLTLSLQSLPRDPDRATIQIRTSWLEQPENNSTETPCASDIHVAVQPK